MTKYFEARITDKADSEAPTRNRARAIFLAVKDSGFIKMKQKIEKIGTAAAMRCSQVYFGS